MKVYKKNKKINNSEYIKIYSVRNEEEIKQLFQNKVLKANHEIIKKFWSEDENFLLSYNWMNQQCKLRLNNYNEQYPLWGWIKKPNKKLLYKEYKNQPFYIVKLIIKRNKVLISDFDLWHFILGDSYIPNKLKNLDKFDHISVFQNRGSQNEIQQVVDSWDKIFNIKKTRKCKQQCCFAEINLDNVIQIKKYQKG